MVGIIPLPRQNAFICVPSKTGGAKFKFHTTVVTNQTASTWTCESVGVGPHGVMHPIFEAGGDEAAHSWLRTGFAIYADTAALKC
ncbi:hypothetical protein Ddc_15974 [Ditylenchus destructor]|nr:hypothetical protein Ddc_15974 [Ditylenchus destructor]